MKSFLAAGPVALLLLSAAPGFAEITLSEAKYEAGILLIEGRTSHPNREISLDGRFSQKANEGGAFQFRIEYLPNDCTVSLFDGEAKQTAVVKGCKTKDPVDAAADLRPTKDATERPVQ